MQVEYKYETTPEEWSGKSTRSLTAEFLSWARTMNSDGWVVAAVFPEACKVLFWREVKEE